MIEELTQKLSELRDQKNRLNDEAQECAEKRNNLNDKVKDLRTEASALRAERDKVNERVKELKQMRNEGSTKIHQKIETIGKLNQERKILAEKKPQRSHQSLQKEVDSIDWKIQTTSLSLQEDKELVEKVKQLESQLNIYRKLEQLNQKILELRVGVKNLKNENESNHKELTEDAKKSQDIHAKMLERIDESKKLKAEADSMHKQYLESREKSKPLQDELNSLSNHIRQLRVEIQAEEEKEKKQDQDMLRETLEKQAREKLKRGEKLSWEEFQLLAEKGLDAQD